MFNKDIAISIDFDIDEKYIEKCIISIQNLKDDIINQFCNSAIRYCEDYRKEFEFLNIEIPKNLVGRDILKYISPLNIIIEKTKFKVPTFCIEFDCK